MSMDAVVKITQSGEAATRSLRALRQEVREAEREVAQLQRLIDKPLVSGVELGKDARDQARQQLEAQLSVALENLRTRTGALAAAERQAGADAGEGRGVDSALNISSGGRGAQPARSSSGGRGFAAPSDPFGIGMAAAANQQTPGNDADPFTRMLDRHTQSIARANFATTAMGYSHQRLRTEWRDSSIRIAEVDRSIGALTARYESLKEAQQELDGVKDRDKLSQVGTELSDIQTMLPTMMRERATLADQAQALRNAALARGGTVSAVGQLSLPSGVQRAAGAFLGGMGIGSGSIGGTIAGGLLGAVSPVTAIAGVLGLMAGKGVQMLQEAYQTQMRMVQRALPMAQATGTSAYSLIEAARGYSDQYKVFDVEDQLRASLALGRATGRTDIASSILPVAALTGQNASEEAGRIGALSRYGAQYNPYLSGALLRAYGGSALARPRLGGRSLPPDVHGPEVPPLPFETLLYPEFAQGMGRVAQGFGSPYTRVSLEATAGMLAGATHHLRMPGVDPKTIGGLDVATNMLLGTGQAISGPHGGAIGSLQMLAMMELRKNSDVVARLKKEDIDINTVPGMRRAIKRGPELFGKGIPEVMESILGIYGRYTSPDLLEMMLGGDEAAHKVATDPAAVLATFRSRPRGRKSADDREFTDEDLERRALGIQQVPGVDQFYQYGIRPQNLALDLARELAGPMGEALTKGLNDIRAEVQTTLFNFLNSETSYGPNAALPADMTRMPVNPAVVGGAGYFMP